MNGPSAGQPGASAADLLREETGRGNDGRLDWSGEPKKKSFSTWLTVRSIIIS